MAKQTIQIADKPTLDEVAENVTEIKESVGNVADKPTLDEIKAQVDLIKINTEDIAQDFVTLGKIDTLNAVDVVERQSMIVAGDYIIKFLIADNSTKTTTDGVFNTNVYYMIKVLMYNRKTEKLTETYIPVYGVGNTVPTNSTMEMYYRLYHLLQTSWGYKYDEATNEVFMYGLYDYYSTSYEYRMHVARFKISEVSNNSKFELLKASYVKVTTYTSDTNSKLYWAKPLYVPSLGKIFIYLEYYSSYYYHYFFSIDVSEFISTGATPTSTSLYTSGTNTDSTLPSVMYGRLVYQGNNTLRAYNKSSSSNVNGASPSFYYATITTDYLEITISEDFTSATVKKSAITRNIFYHQGGVYARKPSYTISTRRNTYCQTIWYEGYQYIITTEGYLMQLFDYNLMSEIITKFPFVPQCWNIDGSILTLYGLDDNNYLLMCKYDMSTMSVRKAIDDVKKRTEEEYFY